MSDDVGKILQDRYHLTKLLGEGGMAAVYEAEHTVIGRKVAVKVLHPRLTDDATARSRMIREAKVAGSLGHPNVVDVQDVGTTDDGGVYIVMEKLEGISLGDLIKSEGRLPVERAVAIVEQLCKGLRAAHDQGAVHRDLKPDNVFLVPDGEGGPERVKILDFGISKLSSLAEDEGLTRDGLLVGTPHYMAPEHAEGSQHVDLRCDLWSVGVLLYVMLTGELPFPGDNYNAILANVLFKKPRPLRELAPEAPEALESIVHKALTREPASRYQQASELMQDLSRLKLGTRRSAVTRPQTTLPGADSISPSGDAVSTDAPTRAMILPPVPEGELDSDAPTEASSDEDSKATPQPEPEPEPELEPVTGPTARISLWEQLAWLTLAIPLSWLLWFPAWQSSAFLHHAFGLDVSWGANLARLVLAAVVVGVTLLVVVLSYSLGKPLRRRWPRGLWHLLLPTAVAGTAFMIWRRFTQQRAIQLDAVERFAIVDEVQAQDMATHIASSQALLCLVLAAVGVFVWLLASRVLLRDLFAGAPRGKSRPGGGRGVDELRRTIATASFKVGLLAGGCLLILVAEVLVFPHWLPVIGQLPGQGGTGWHRVLIYLTWLVTGIAILRARGASTSGLTGGRTWLVGFVAVAALTLASIALAHARLHDLIGAPPRVRAVADDAIFQLRQANQGSLGGLIAFLSLLLILFTLLRLAVRKSGSRFGIRAVGRGLLALVVVALMVLPLPLPWLASRSLPRVYLPHAVSQMHPVSVTPGAEPAVYVDKLPRTLVAGRKPLWVALTSGSRVAYREGALRKVLAGYKHCPVLLDRALGLTKKVTPARCVTGVEARHYCEALGMRLPTPAEWAAALGKIRLRPKASDKSPETPFRRGYFGEWTLHVVHGTPTIAVRGQRWSKRIPAKLSADAFSQFVGFRCAYPPHPRR